MDSSCPCGKISVSEITAFAWDDKEPKNLTEVSMRRIRILRFSAMLVLCGSACCDRLHPSLAASPPEMFDTVVIVNGHIIDGTGSPWYSGEIGIRAGHIAAIGNLEARRAGRPSMPRKGGGAGIHRHAGPVGADHTGRSAPAVEDFSGHHNRSHWRGRLGCAH
jgi:hypothetical protein